MSASLATTSGPITPEWRLDETTERYPSTGPIFLQRGATVGLRADDPTPTPGEYAVRGGLAVQPLLELLYAAAETDRFTRASSGSRSKEDRSGRGRRTPSGGSVGYTGRNREAPADVLELIEVAVLLARGQE
jgi:hypothetical protein